jgi:outer membrane lipoprotein SlyB
MNRPMMVVLAITVTLVMAACESPRRVDDRRARYDPPPESAEKVRFGVVSDIDVFEDRARTSGGGAILGAVIGGVVGNQIGSGSGRAAATGAGVIGGAIVGNAIEERNRRDDEFFRVTVRLNNGARREFDYKQLNGLRVGDRVQIDDGQLVRL